MTDAINIAGSKVEAAKPSRTRYQSEEGREVQARAQFLEQNQSPQEQAGLKRLHGLLNQGTPLEQGAPRGYYLNIRI
ncbi:hypothetical protein N8000_06920 [Rhodospirillales bacterium]|jgi:hypothetical protein|nr:hypothetical protein [Rhodospirillales bacterium]